MSRQLRLSALASTAALAMLALATSLGGVPVAQDDELSLALGIPGQMR